MTIRQLYEFAIQKGLELDPRGAEELARQVEEAKAEYNSLDEKGKLLFDSERFNNPFGDTRMVCGDETAEVKRLVCGIDISGAEVLMAEALRHKGTPVDLVLGHHTSPVGGGLGSRRDTIWPQVKMLADFGVPRHKAEKLVRKNATGDQRTVNYQANQIAQALGMPLMTIHSPADLYLLCEGKRVMEEEQPKTVGDLVDICDGWPEVQWMMDRGKGTEVAVGDKHDPLGKVYACFYGGWNPTPEVFEALCEAGCGTLWVVATSEELNEVGRKKHVSIVVLPHWPADNLGLNQLLDDAMDEHGAFDVIDSSNFVRIERRAR